MLLGGPVLGLEAMLLAGVGSLVVAAMGAGRLLAGKAYVPTQADVQSLDSIGLALRDGAFAGTLAGFPATVEPDVGSVMVSVTGLPEGWEIEPGPEGPTLEGVLTPVRPRREALLALWEAVQRAEIDASEGALRMEVPNALAGQGGLGPVVAQLADVLVRFHAVEPWEEVAQDVIESRELRLYALRRLLRVEGPALERVAAELLDDPDPLVQLVAECVAGEVGGLEAFCRGDAASLVVEVLPFLPDALRGEVLAARVTESEGWARTFVLDLVKRWTAGQAPVAEMRALASAVHAGFDGRDPLLRQARFRGLEGAIRPFAIAVQCVAKEDAAEARPWVPVCLEMLAESVGPDAEALVAALCVAATVEDVPALRRIDSYGARAVVAAIQARSGADRGGLALADTAGGDLAVAMLDGLTVPDDETS